MADADDVDALRRRGRRRLLGAIALVLLAVIVLPMVFEDAPRREHTRVSVQVPLQDNRPFSPEIAGASGGGERVAATPQAGTSTSTRGARSEAVVPLPLPAVKPDAQEPALREAGTGNLSGKTDGREAPKAPPPSRKAVQQPAPPPVDEFIVPVAALANTEKVRELTRRLSAAKIPNFTQPVKTADGMVTRVRAGPFANREVAERAASRIRQMGLDPGSPVLRTE